MKKEIENNIKEKAIKEGIKSLMTEKYKSKFILEGGKIGFEMTRNLETKEDFEKAIWNSLEEDNKLRIAEKVDTEKYWHQRYKTFQLEWMFEIMKYIWGGFESYSARAGKAISRFLKELNIDEKELGFYLNLPK